MNPFVAVLAIWGAAVILYTVGRILVVLFLMDRTWEFPWERRH